MRIWTTLLFACCMLGFAYAQVTYEDFEAGALQAWNASDGTFDGVFANPDSTVVNPSDSVGSYTKSDMHAFSLFLTTLASPMNLSTNNAFHIQINAPVASQFIMKLEGPSGSVEQTKNIAITNTWVEYVFDFSAAAGATDYDKIILFFDPGVTNSSDTYLFDNIVAFPAGACAGTTPDPAIIDDFECQRNATYGSGYFNLEAIPNPDPSSINTSASVGEYLDPADQWSALVVDYHNPIDLGTFNTYKMKVWAPKTGDVLMKLEGGASAPFEIFIPITVTNEWVEVSADFSSQASANHKKLAIFMNAGIQADSNDIYYIDDFVREETPLGTVLEDFDPMKLFWEPLGSNTAVHGTFAMIANPDPSGDNTSGNVGEHVKGSSNLSTLTGTLSAPLDLSADPQLNIQVWPPAGATELTMQLNSLTQGNKDVTVPFTGSGAWETLSFDFSNFSSIADFNSINLQFDPGAAGAGTYYFDNLIQTQSSVDPCAGVTPIPTILDNYECQRNATYGAGANELEVVDNPDVSQANGSLKVGKYTDPMDEWSALAIDFGAPVDLSLYNQLLIKIWAENAVPLKFKLEGGSSAPVEIDQTVSATNEWVQYSVDFSGQAGENHQRIAIFFNAGVMPSQQDVYYLDDIELTRAPYTGCIATFENTDFTIDAFTYFANGALDTVAFGVIENPDKSGVNTSDSVGIFQESADGQTFAGMYTDLDAPVSLPNGNKIIRMKMWADHAATMVFKLESGRDNAPASGDITADYTTPNAWQELTFDFSAIVPDDALYDRITLIPDINNIPIETKEYYFDDIIIADGLCGVTGIFKELKLASLTVFPNPSNGACRIEAQEGFTSAIVTNLMGQVIYQENFNRRTALEVDLGDATPGIYFISTLRGNQLLGRSKLVIE